MFEQVFNGMMTDPSTHAMSALGESMVEPFSEGLHSPPVRKKSCPETKDNFGKATVRFYSAFYLEDGHPARIYAVRLGAARYERLCSSAAIRESNFPASLAVGRRRFEDYARSCPAAASQHQRSLFLGKAFQIMQFVPASDHRTSYAARGWVIAVLFHAHKSLETRCRNQSLPACGSQHNPRDICDPGSRLLGRSRRLHQQQQRVFALSRESSFRGYRPFDEGFSKGRKPP